MYFDATNPLHWLARIHLHAAKLLVPDEFGHEIQSLLTKYLRNLSGLKNPKMQHDNSWPDVIISYLQRKVRTSHMIPAIFNINQAKMRFEDKKAIIR